MPTVPYITPRKDDVLTSLRNFLLSVLPAGTEVIRGQDNRVSAPLGGDFCVMTPLLMNRLETNVDLYGDCAFTGSIAGGTLTVSFVQFGTITLGNQLFGSGISSTVFISTALSGTGGVGTYGLSGTLVVIGAETMACGNLFAMQPTEWTIQIDVYGPNSADNAAMISTLFRDDFAIESFTNSNSAAPPGWQNIPPGGTISVFYDAVRPLYADDPRQMSQVFGEQQWEQRWTVDACMQANQIVVAPQQFAGALKVNPIDVPLVYPP